MAENENPAAGASSEEGISADVARVEAEVHDEIDDIMAEIEKIKSNMAPVAPMAQETASAVDAPSAEAEPLTAEVDFGQGNTDAPIEETLGSMEVEEVSGGLLVEGAEPTVEPEVQTTAAESEPEPALAPEPQMKPAAVTPFVPKLVKEEGPPPVQKVTVPSQMGGDVPANVGMLSMTLTGSMKLALKYEMDGQEVTIGFDSQFLHLSLADGSEFKIPVVRERRKAA